MSRQVEVRPLKRTLQELRTIHQLAGDVVAKSYQQQAAEFKRLARVKQSAPTPTAALGPELISFFKQSVQKRQTKLTQIAECWSKLIPETINDHCALDSLVRGTLTVLVDTASHLYELKQLLLAGQQQQLLLACKSAGLKKIVLRPGRWYDGEEEAGRKIRFDR